MINNVKVDRINGSDIYITINCFEDSNRAHQNNNALKIPIRRIEKPPHEGGYKDPIVVIDGKNWPNFVEYVSKRLNNDDKNSFNCCNNYTV